MEPETSNNEESSLKGKKVYIVEDDGFLGKILSQRIAGDVAESTVFKTGEDALLAIEKTIPDAIIMDVMLPGMDGFTILETLKKNEKTKNIPVLMASNANQPENQERAKALGAEFLMKALTTPVEIVDKVKEMLRK